MKIAVWLFIVVIVASIAIGYAGGYYFPPMKKEIEDKS